MKIKFKARIMGQEEIERAMARVVHQILERNPGANNLATVGIRRKGADLAKRLSDLIAKVENAKVPLGTLDIVLYDDDLNPLYPAPLVRGVDVPFDVNGKDIILCDDVLHTGRTVTRALNELISLGVPNSIQLFVLIDRGQRQLPIKADYACKVVPTSAQEMVIVKMKEMDGVDEITIVERQG